MAHEFGIRLALIAFATASFQGVFRGSDFQESLTAALVCLILFYVVGHVCGELARRVIEENVKSTLASSGSSVSAVTPSTRN